MIGVSPRMFTMLVLVLMAIARTIGTTPLLRRRMPRAGFRVPPGGEPFEPATREAA